MSNAETKEIREANAKAQRHRLSQLTATERNVLLGPANASKRQRFAETNETQRNAFREAHANADRLSQMSDAEAIALRQSHAEAQLQRNRQLKL